MFGYVTPWVIPTGHRDGALLVLGREHHGNFEHESPASDDFAPETLHRFRQATMTRLRRLVTLSNLRRGGTPG
ncbi:hypothetical protein Aple_044840 [Acrocarpospora pleiomorpha]|uniref:Uncharacterized protein n=1 Tax=Acrocarpospora pleiomorpha TaxID=90975 RepID=A0A5M3XT72_9ACTN|nr:hypothetical protein [Acrocarpospora pleiomorpha]GES21588.1 hypothetical protein Aple_044840 [Acrocarpospora pleiomorpha]